ncbi:MAG TPA: iron-sulfur cluster assembly accessory protein [Urbifossiella sp.]|nr:iron-sulfur cluster assembly accessory protein [Urbifossiella sp.]
MATATETIGLGRTSSTPAPVAAPLTVTERAAEEVRRHIADVAASGSAEAGSPLYLRVRVQGGGCSGFQNKLDLDPKYDEKTDHKFEFHGIEVVVDKRSMLYLDGAVVDFHDDLNKRGFTVNNPSAKSTCGCGSSYSM